MGANLSQFLFNNEEHTPDYSFNGNNYIIKGTYFSTDLLLLLYVVNIIICGQARSGKSLLFKNLQKSGYAKTKKEEDPLESTTIEWINPYTLEKAKVNYDYYGQYVGFDI